MSESRRKKQLEKKKAKRKEKIKEKLRIEQTPLRELPLEKSLINDDWSETRYARILMSRRHPDATYSVCEFLVDLDGFGLRDCFGPKRLSAEAHAEHIRRQDRVNAEPALCAALVHGGVHWANQYRFALPKDARRAIDILPAEAGEPPAEFGRNGEPYLRGDEADVRARLRQSGLRLEDFECEVLPARAAAGKEQRHFVTDDYLRQGDRNDPLVRLERLAALADRYEQARELPKAEELHRTMEELAEQTNRKADFLKYLARYYLRQERMEKALDTFGQVVAATEEPRAKALAQLDLADLSRYLGDALGADEMYQRVLAEHPDLAIARLRYATFLCEAARRDEGKEKYRELIAALAAKPEEKDVLARAYQDLYTILGKEGASADAKALYKEAKRAHGIHLR